MWLATNRGPFIVLLQATNLRPALDDIGDVSGGPVVPTIDAVVLRAAIGRTVLAGALTFLPGRAVCLLSDRSSTMIRWSPTL
jgi:hypothetical protein